MNEMKKSPFLAGLLSTMPGLGQVYVGYYVSGFVNVLVVAGIIGVLATGGGPGRGFEPFLGLFLAFFWLFNIVDAVRKANLYNLHQLGEREERLPTDSPLIGGAVLLIAGVLLTLHFTLGLEMAWLQQVWPLALLLAGGYLIWKYQRTKRELRGRENIVGLRREEGGQPHREEGTPNQRS
jgi:TM2 domain-containing membrane protein YozV